MTVRGPITQGNQKTNTVLGSAIGGSMTSGDSSFINGLKKSIKDLERKKKDIEGRVNKTIKMYKDKHGPLAGYFLDKPSSQYNDYDKKIADLNPDLYTISKQIDDYRDQANLIDKDKINLENSLKQITGAYDQQANNINKNAEIGLNSIGTQKAVQQGALQGLAGKYGATTGMMSKGTSEIENAFAPKEAQIEQQRQAGLAQVASGRAGIPAQLSALAAQNKQIDQTNTNLEYSKAKLKNYLSRLYTGINNRNNRNNVEATTKKTNNDNSTSSGSNINYDELISSLTGSNK